MTTYFFSVCLIHYSHTHFKIRFGNDSVQVSMRCLSVCVSTPERKAADCFCSRYEGV